MSEAEIADLNVRIASGALRFATGMPVAAPLSAALVTADGAAVYPVLDGITTLLPAMRISITGGAAAALSGEDRSTDERWEDLAAYWPSVGPPLRPSAEDVAAIEHILAERMSPSGAVPTRALLLGVTPELAAMRWPADTELLAVDFSVAMIGKVWRRPDRVRAAVVRGNWTALPIRDASCHVITGDGNLTSLTYPTEYRELARELGRVVAAPGLLVLRLFARPERPDSLDAIFADLRAGRIRDSSMLPWRIAMALHGDLASGVRAGLVWEAWCEHVPDVTGLMRDLGWPNGAERAIEWTRGQQYTMRFPTLREVVELFASDFDLVHVNTCEYEWASLYPTVVFAPRRSGRR